MTAATLTEWDEPSARAIVRRLVERKAPLFGIIPEYGLDDLESEGLIAARRAWPNFDPGKSRQSTFIYTVAGRRLIDLQRTATCRRAREIRYAGAAARRPELQNVCAARHEITDLAEWTADRLRTIRRTIERYELSRRLPGVRGINRAQAAALIALRAKAKMDNAALIDWLLWRADVLAALGLRHPPALNTLARAERHFPRINFGNTDGGPPRPREPKPRPAPKPLNE